MITDLCFFERHHRFIYLCVLRSFAQLRSHGPSGGDRANPRHHRFIDLLRARVLRSASFSWSFKRLLSKSRRRTPGAECVRAFIRVRVSTSVERELLVASAMIVLSEIDLRFAPSSGSRGGFSESSKSRQRVCRSAFLRLVTELPAASAMIEPAEIDIRCALSSRSRGGFNESQNL